MTSNPAIASYAAANDMAILRDLDHHIIRQIKELSLLAQELDQVGSSDAASVVWDRIENWYATTPVSSTPCRT